MNLILFTEDELENGIREGDGRVVHVRNVLGFGPDDWFDIGIINGPMGKARLASSDDERVHFEYRLGDEPPPLHPVSLIVGMPRPQTARRLLREMTTMGVARIWFAVTDRSEAGYSDSKLWTTGEYVRHLRQGAEQAFSTRIPDLRRFDSLAEALDEAAGIAGTGARSVALDNYEDEPSLSDWLRGRALDDEADSPESILAIGAERGWSAGERDLLRGHRFDFVHLGDRVLRVETAAIAATAILLAERGIL